MSDNVIRAFGNRSPEEDRERYLEILETVRAQIMSGRVRGLLTCVVLEGGDIWHDYFCKSWMEGLGVVERLRHRMNQDIDEG